MADCMMFPDTVEEYMEKCKIVDTEQVYTNGAELVPIFRMKQWFEHEPERKKGKWITETINNYTKRTYCSVCNNKVPVVFVSNDYYANRAHGEINFTNYCPNCGADMMSERRR